MYYIKENNLVKNLDDIIQDCDRTAEYYTKDHNSKTEFCFEKSDLVTASTLVRSFLLLDH